MVLIFNVNFNVGEGDVERCVWSKCLNFRFSFNEWMNWLNELPAVRTESEVVSKLGWLLVSFSSSFEVGSVATKLEEAAQPIKPVQFCWCLSSGYRSTDNLATDRNTLLDNRLSEWNACVSLECLRLIRASDQWLDTTE